MADDAYAPGIVVGTTGVGVGGANDTLEEAVAMALQDAPGADAWATPGPQSSGPRVGRCTGAPAIPTRFRGAGENLPVSGSRLRPAFAFAFAFGLAWTLAMPTVVDFASFAFAFFFGFGIAVGVGALVCAMWRGMRV